MEYMCSLFIICRSSHTAFAWMVLADYVGSFCDDDFKACTAINRNPAVLCVLKSLFSNWSGIKELDVNRCADFCKATLVYINEGCGLKYLGMFNTVHLSKNMMESLFAVPRKLSHKQWSALSPSLPVRSRLNSNRQAPELGKCLCNLSSDTVLPAALPGKWKNVERALSNPSQHNESSFQNYCNWDAALLAHASSYNKLNKTKATTLPFERNKRGGNHMIWYFVKVA